jgi:hypothetical protein
MDNHLLNKREWIKDENAFAIKKNGSFWRNENNDDLYIIVSNVFQNINILKTDSDEIL